VEHAPLISGSLLTHSSVAEWAVTGWVRALVRGLWRWASDVHRIGHVSGRALCYDIAWRVRDGSFIGRVPREKRGAWCWVAHLIASWHLGLEGLAWSDSISDFLGLVSDSHKSLSGFLVAFWRDNASLMRLVPCDKDTVESRLKESSVLLLGARDFHAVLLEFLNCET
jgi:hypothetical protein